MESNLLIPTKIVRSKRKSISLIIQNNGDFIVRAPVKTKDNEIYKFINKKADWIISKRTQQLSNIIKPLSVIENEKISLLGEEYIITIYNLSRVKVKNNLIILPKENAKIKLIAFIKKLAKNYLTTRVEQISQLFGFKFTSISISSAKTCWGSCSYNNKLHFTYKLMLCPKDVIDYIILHELCHTIEKNHSIKFWNLVRTHNPFYKTSEKWLKVNRGVIDLI